MPEVVERKYLCDHPAGDGLDAKIYVIDDGRNVVRVLLCDDHAEGLCEIMEWGQKIEPASQPRAGGLGEGRLRGLIDPE